MTVSTKTSRTGLKASRQSENALIDQRLFLLNDIDWKKFQEALNSPASVKPGLKKLMQTTAPWSSESS